MPSHGIKLVDDLKAALRERVFSPRRRNGTIGRAAHHGWCALVRAYLGVCHRLAVRGRRHIPARPPYVLVANHLSHLDALVLASALPCRLWDRVFPVAAEDTCFAPPVRAAFVACVVNALPIDRRRRGLHGGSRCASIGGATM
jgi:1-acyl-sn-glycerol-3-phosphate acyltransferase